MHDEYDSDGSNDVLLQDIFDDTYTKIDVDAEEIVEKKTKPKSILIAKEDEKVLKKSKSNRFVSFTLDDSKPFTSSVYFGVRSYLHHFYEPVNKATDEDGAQGVDDFEFVIEPGQRRRKNWWFRVSMAFGLVVLITGIVLIVVGNFTTLRNPLIGKKDNLEILDQKAIKFNQRIEMCQFSGLLLFTVGGFITLLAILISAYEQECGCGTPVLYSTVDRDTWIRYGGYNSAHNIPVSEEIKAVQMESAN